MSENIQRAITAIKSGDKNTGKNILIKILKSDSRNEEAWLWMTKVVDSDNKRIECLQKVLEINPNNEIAKRGIVQLQQKEKITSKRLNKRSKKSKLRFWLIAILGGLLFFGFIGRLVTESSTITESTEQSEQTVSRSTTTSDVRFLITEYSLGSKKALENEIVSKGWKFKDTEIMTDGTHCDTYESSHVIFGLCSDGDELKVIIIKGDAFASFDPVFDVASIYDVHYVGDFKDEVTDVWFDLPPGDSTTLDIDPDGVIMTIQKTYGDGYAITYILESHLP